MTTRAARDDGPLYLDTHVVVWLRRGDHGRLPSTVRERLARHAELRISPMVLVELDVLREIGRLREDATTIVGALSRGLGLRVCELPFASVAAASASLTWTRDPFDRLIVAQAFAAGARLVTRDVRIRRSSPAVAYWE